MGSRIQELIENLYNMIMEAGAVPFFKDRCSVDRNKALDALEEIRSQFPQELAEAQRLLAARTEFINNAKREADALRKAAEERSRQLVDSQEVYTTARKLSNELMETAEKNSSDLRHAANEYVDDSMRRTEEALTAALDEMRRTRVKFREAAKTVSQTQTQPEPEHRNISEFDV
jgi:hypothetical protein